MLKSCNSVTFQINFFPYFYHYFQKRQKIGNLTFLTTLVSRCLYIFWLCVCLNIRHLLGYLDIMSGCADSLALYIVCLKVLNKIFCIFLLLFPKKTKNREPYFLNNPRIILLYFNGKVGSLQCWTLQKILIISKNASNKSFAWLNFLQKFSNNRYFFLRSAPKWTNFPIPSAL